MVFIDQRILQNHNTELQTLCNFNYIQWISKSYNCNFCWISKFTALFYFFMLLQTNGALFYFLCFYKQMEHITYMMENFINNWKYLHHFAIRWEGLHIWVVHMYLIGNLTSSEIVNSLTRIAFRSNHYWIKPPFNLFNILNAVIVCISLFKILFWAEEKSIKDGYLILSKTDFYLVPVPYTWTIMEFLNNCSVILTSWFIDVSEECPVLIWC